MSEDEDEDSLAWEEWQKMTDEQQDALLEREQEKLTSRLSALSPAQVYAYRRGSMLESIVRWRRILSMMDLDTFRGQLRQAQVRLVKLRIWRKTGLWPGEG